MSTNNDHFAYYRNENKFTDELSEYFRESIEKNCLTLVILKGLPGIGKSSFAKRMVELNAQYEQDIKIFEADDFFMEEGNYVFKKELLTAAHASCEVRVAEAMRLRTKLIINSNNNIRSTNFEVYRKLFVENGYDKLIIIDLFREVLRRNGLSATEWNNQWIVSKAGIINIGRKSNNMTISLAKTNAHNVGSTQIRKWMIDYEFEQASMVVYNAIEVVTNSEAVNDWEEYDSAFQQSDEMAPSKEAENDFAV